MSIYRSYFSDACCGLNPYSTGRYSMRHLLLRKSVLLVRLNPYSTGRYSMRNKTDIKTLHSLGVLILILLEDTL